MSIIVRIRSDLFNFWPALVFPWRALPRPNPSKGSGRWTLANFAVIVKNVFILPPQSSLLASLPLSPKMLTTCSRRGHGQCSGGYWGRGFLNSSWGWDRAETPVCDLACLPFPAGTCPALLEGSKLQWNSTSTQLWEVTSKTAAAVCSNTRRNGEPLILQILMHVFITVSSSRNFSGAWT